jgi:uncharacterized protein (DUF885 family)
MTDHPRTSPDASARLAELADRFWQTSLDADPLLSTEVGAPGRDALLPPLDPAARNAIIRRLEAQNAEVEALDPAALPDADRITRDALLQAITSTATFIRADSDAFTIDPMGGPQVSFLNVADYQAVQNVDEGRDMVERWRAMGPWVDELIGRQRQSIADGRPPVRILCERVIDEVDSLLGQPDEAWPLLSPARTEHPGWSASEADAFRSDLAAAVRDGIRPAFERYRAFVRDEALPVARGDADVGLAALTGGSESYRALARAHTTTELDPEELHAIGLREIERIDGELIELGGRLLGADGLADTVARLRSDRALSFDSGDEIEAVARRSMARAQEATPDWFNRLPRTPVEVVAMGAHEEEHSTIAYYRDPAVDGSRPGRYFVNRSHPETRPRYEAEALAFHESVPGHHLQVALAQELTTLPDFRRHALTTAFVEGWGLYAERLSSEMGLYSGDLDRIGIASFDAWRASRLVVDSGMHALGWSRSRAIAFMTEHTALGTNNIANEVDRYIVWPGQALAYKIGQLEFLRLRDEARHRLGERFDIRRFHDAVLEPGALPLDVLRGVVERTLR